MSDMKTLNRPGESAFARHHKANTKEYTEFVETVRRFSSEEREAPIDAAIDYCKEHDILREFLVANEGEVKKVMTIDMTFERRLELNGKECREEGRAEGLEEGRKSTILYAYHNGHSVEEIHEFIGCDISEIEAAIAEEGKNH